jgi:hypothetical protein
VSKEEIAMIKRHEDALMNALEQLDHVGWVEIEWWKIYQWYSAERLTKKVYRDLRDRFLESGDEVELHMYEGPNLLLVKGDRLTSFSTKLGEDDE